MKEAKDAKKEAVVELEKGAETVVRFSAPLLAQLWAEVLGQADLPAVLARSGLSLWLSSRLADLA